MPVTQSNILLANNVIQELDSLTNPLKIEHAKRFFKTGKGQYGEGDQFIGLTVPEQRKIAKKYMELSVEEVLVLLASPIHEHRLTGLLILVYKYPKASTLEQQRIVEAYLVNTKKVNNWDLVDLSAPKILGEYFYDKDKSIFYTLAKSNNLWERRISIVSTYAFIKKGLLDETIIISQMLLNDNEDLIHKAVGWMLRELGKKKQTVLEDFLNTYATRMPRTMLRYSIEKFDEPTRQKYLKAKSA